MEPADPRLNSVLPTLSLRTRLTLLWCAVSLIVLLALEVITLAVLNAQANATVDRDLALEAHQYQQAVAGARTVAELRTLAQTFLQGDSQGGTGFATVYLVRFTDGSTLTNSANHGLQATMTATTQAPGVPATAHDEHAGDFRVVSIPVEQGSTRVADLFIAIPLSGVRSALSALLAPLLVANALLVGLVRSWPMCWSDRPWRRSAASPGPRS